MNEAFAGFSNLLSFSAGIYIVMFLALPFTEKLYTILEPKIGRKDITKNEEEWMSDLIDEITEMTSEGILNWILLLTIFSIITVIGNCAGYKHPYQIL